MDIPEVEKIKNLIARQTQLGLEDDEIIGNIVDIAKLHAPDSSDPMGLLEYSLQAIKDFADSRGIQRRRAIAEIDGPPCATGDGLYCELWLMGAAVAAAEIELHRARLQKLLDCADGNRIVLLGLGYTMHRPIIDTADPQQIALLSHQAEVLDDIEARPVRPGDCFFADGRGWMYGSKGLLSLRCTFI